MQAQELQKQMERAQLQGETGLKSDVLSGFAQNPTPFLEGPRALWLDLVPTPLEGTLQALDYQLEALEVAGDNVLFRQEMRDLYGGFVQESAHHAAGLTVKPVTQALLKGTLVGDLLEPELIVADKPKTLLFSPHAPVPRTNSTTATASGQVAQEGFWQAFSRGHQQMHFIRDVDAHPSQVAFAQGGAKPIPAQTPGAWSLVWDAALQNDPLAQQQLRGYFPRVAAFTDGMKEFQESPTGQTLDTIAKPIAKAGLMVMASEAIALNAAGKSMLNAYGNYKTIAKASSMADGLRLKAELAFKEAGFLDQSGKLTALALKGGKVLKDGIRLQNPSVIKELTKNGQPMKNWRKYATKDIQFKGHKYQIHFYFNEVTKEVNYTHVDFKINRPIEFFEKPTANVPSTPKPKL